METLSISGRDVPSSAPAGLRIGILGGGPLPKQWGLDYRPLTLQTPFGEPSAPVLETRIGPDTLVCSLLRHGEGHAKGYAVNYRANVAALHALKCDAVISLSLAGTLCDRFDVGDIVIYDDIIDFRRSVVSFFLDEAGVHCAMAPLVSDPLRAQLQGLSHELEVPFGATMVVIEGPRYSTRAESCMYARLGGELICQTVAPECFLVREKGMDWFGVCLVTDRDTSDPVALVSTELIYKTMKQYEAVFAQTILRLVRGLRPLGQAVDSERSRVPRDLLTS
jgi:5'-methylthioadenosine phosphorylase